MTRRIAIVGTVGVPARYGGFETLAEQLATHLDPADFPLTIYCQRSAYPELATATPFKGHARIMVPLRANGLASIIYDWWSLAHAVFVARVETILVLGVSGALLLPLIRLVAPRVRIVTNVDGMEWRRDKFGTPAKLLLRSFEWLAARASHRVIADNAAIADLICAEYRVEPAVIAYGGDHTLVEPEATAPQRDYWLSIARIEPENNCAMILEAFATAGQPLVFIGNWAATAYGQYLKARYSATSNLTLLDPIYDQARLAGWRASAAGYVHGHSVGGTNPSLVEALFWTARLLSFDCVFNRATTGGEGAWFASAVALQELLSSGRANGAYIGPEALAALRARYCWSEISALYEACLV